MQDITYKKTATDKFAWKKVDFDPKLFGTKADLAGLVSIETISGDDVHELLQSLGKSPSKQSKKVDAPKKLKGPKPPHSDTNSNIGKSVETAAKALTPAALKRKLRKKKQLELKRKLKKRQESAPEDERGGPEPEPQDIDDDEGKSSDVSDEVGAGGGEEEPGADGPRRTKRRKTSGAAACAHESDDDTAAAAAASAAAAAAAAEYDDAWEYGEWGGIMLRKCVARAGPRPARASKRPTQRP